MTNFLGVMMDFVSEAAAGATNDADKPPALRCSRRRHSLPQSSISSGERFGIEAFTELFGTHRDRAPILTPYGEARPPGAAGLLADDWDDVQLVDPETDIEVPIGEVGEMVVRPKHPWICSLGYYNMPEKTSKVTGEKMWFHSGDALRRDKQGWYYFVDRYKDAIRRRGENISSYEVDKLSLGIRRVSECAVIAVPADEEAGEDEVMACVVTNPGTDPGEIWAFCSRRVPAFAVPRLSGS